MFEKAPEEYFADAGRRLSLLFEHLSVEDLEPHLPPPHLQHTFRLAVDDAQRGKERLVDYCDGPTSWGMAEGYQLGKGKAFDDLIALATSENRTDILEWLNTHKFKATRP